MSHDRSTAEQQAGAIKTQTTVGVNEEINYPTLRKLDPEQFTGKLFNWTQPPNKYNQVPHLPIYIGQGEARLPWDATGFPLSDNQKEWIGIGALDFTDQCLKPINASLIVAVSNTSSYFGAYHWGDRSDQFQNRDDIQWLSFVDKNGAVITCIAKRKDNLYHWKIFKEKKLYHEAYILHIKTRDGGYVEIEPEDLQILHAMVCEAVTKNKIIYNHCQEGIGRSGVITLAEIILMQTCFSYSLPINIPIDNANYIIELLSWAHQHIRPGLLGGRHLFSRGLVPNIRQIPNTFDLGHELIELHSQTNNPEEVNQQVQITDEEERVILNYTTSLERNILSKKTICLEIRNRYFEQVIQELTYSIKRFQSQIQSSIKSNDYLQSLSLIKELSSSPKLKLVRKQFQAEIFELLQMVFLSLYGLERSHPQYKEIIKAFQLFLLSLPESYTHIDMWNAVDYARDVAMVKSGETNCLAALRDHCFNAQGMVKKSFYSLIKFIIQSHFDKSAAYFSADIKKVESALRDFVKKPSTFWEPNDNAFSLWCLNTISQVRISNKPIVDVDAYILQNSRNHPISTILTSEAKKFAAHFTDADQWLTRKLTDSALRARASPLVMPACS